MLGRFDVWGGFEVQGVWFRVEGLGFRIWSLRLRLRLKGLEFSVWVSGFGF
jgi:hypothetical protein